ncbi:Asp-tRNA(Asn)/Glu-tRNA(Gln) amidotransferase GatCAB subunit C [Candidatus Peregrinibacteria bacterium CG_4_9_14_0_2_um_filter_41_14]|nr:MAG: Asp-tRNA(Asn)/Glu-tRNA(Gln) amidotransferase GatCAB subunit C [Candidatus Peregrinibacteria bacterium CG_4_10_14_0_2_um_filter_41_8]PJC37860.1 MAG: Asp-tRNA(Asn)/Glu-tRNA(Gln) amidotransferase GatCAB subunit C [Candidatus Peregrinibacteria bacterium CG_4_9_14_0_2_um_filter_41_14]
MSDVKITKEVVQRIAHLARLELSEAEVAKFAGQLQDILGAIEILAEVDTEGVKPTAQVTGLTNIFEEDKVIDFVEDKKRLLGNVDGEVIDNQVVVPSVFNS